MSLQDLVDRIDLKPSVPAHADNLTLLWWLWRDPFALEHYLEQTIFFPHEPSALSTLVNYRRRIQGFIGHVAWTAALIWIVELLLILLGISTIPPTEVVWVIFHWVGLAGVIGILFFFITHWVASYRSQQTTPTSSDSYVTAVLTIATLFGFWTWVSLPFLAVAEIWLNHQLAQNVGSSQLIAWMIFLALGSLYFGAIWNGFVYALWRLQAPRWFHAGFRIAVGLCILVILLLWYWQGKLTYAFGVGFWLGWLISLFGVWVGIHRLDDLLSDWAQLHRSATYPDKWVITHMTLRATPTTKQQIQQWLQANWAIGLHNANQIWQYSNLRGVVIGEVCTLLRGLEGDKLLERLVDLSDGQFAWKLGDFFPRGLTVTQSNTGGDVPNILAVRPWVKSSSRHDYHNEYAAEPLPVNSTVPNLADEIHTLAIGLEHLEHCQPTQALAAFAQVSDCTRLAELKQLTQVLRMLVETPNLLGQGPELKWPKAPSPAWRRTSWQALTILKRAFHYVWLYQHCKNPRPQQVAITMANKYFDELYRMALPHPEKFLIWKITKNWQNNLGAIVAGQESFMTPSPVTNPYFTNGPLPAHYNLNGHESTMEKIRTGLRSDTTRPLLLYGQPLIGKTSLLRRVEAEFYTVYLHLSDLALLGDRTGHWLHYISQRIAQLSGQPPPSLAQLQEEPYATFDPYLHHAIRHLKGQNQMKQQLIFAIDGAEQLPQLAPKMAILRNLLTYLEQLYTTRHCAIPIFAGAICPEDFRSAVSCFGSLIQSIPVMPFAQQKAIEASLHQPMPTFFALRYEREAVRRIKEITQGQPYLIQAIGHTMVQSFNQALQRGRHRDPIFTDTDVATACLSPEFKDLAGVYYQRVLDLASSFHHSGPALLRLIAQHGAYPLIQQVAPTIGLTVAQLDQFLRSLDALGIIKLTISATGEPLMATIAVPSLGEDLRHNNNI